MIRSLLALLVALQTSNLPPAFPRDGAKQLIDNDRVTVWDVVIPKGKPTVMHQHKYDMVRVELADTTVRVTNPGGSPGAPGNIRMGTVAFDAKAGEITDVGTVQTSIDAITFPRMLDKAKPEDVDGLRSGAITMMRLTPAGTVGIDPRLSAYKVVPATLKAAGPVPNYYGVQVDRLTAIPNILKYDRDKIIDLTSAAVH